MPGDDDLRCAVGAEPAHRSQPVFQSTVIGFDRVAGVPLEVMPRRWDLLVEHGRIDRSGVVTTSPCLTLSIVKARWNNRRAAAVLRRVRGTR